MGRICRGVGIATVLAGAVALMGALLTDAVAQDKAAAKKVQLKVLADNEKVRVFETTYSPGAENEAPPASSTRVVRVLKGGELTRMYADGKKEKLDYSKVGSVHVYGPTGPYTTKNTGKTVLQLYVVVAK